MRSEGSIRNRTGSSKSLDNSSSPNPLNRKGMVRLTASKENKEMDSSNPTMKALETIIGEEEDNAV
jgi:hypothetical protein